MEFKRITMMCLTLNMCVVSVLAVAILPQNELRELDIFMQNEEYQQISRIKRTGDENEEEGASGAAPPELGLPISNEDDVTLTSLDTNSGASGAAPPELGLPTSNEDDVALTSLDTNSELSGVENPPNEDIDSDQGTTETPDEDSESNAKNDNQGDPTTVNDLQLGDAETTVSVDKELGSITEKPININESVPVITGSRSGLPVQDVPEVQPTNSNANSPTDVQGNPAIPNNVTNTVNTTNIDVSPLPANISVNTSSSAIDTNVVPTNSTITETSKNATNTINNTATLNNSSNAKPDDAPQKSGVSGVGVLFTIVILVVLAGIGAFGYYMYKKKKGGYNPVNVDDQDKEMIEIKPGNGFGKPISADEIKLDDQLTPRVPTAAPRTFTATPTEERKLEEVDVKTAGKSDEESFRTKSEENIEFADERKQNEY